MSNRNEKSVPTLGFLTVVEHTPGGLFGGLLVLNLAGRPLEFHCTAPVKANRAQEILYGPTLKPYLYGEQIGGALLAKLKSPALAVCTDTEHVLSLRDHSDIPVALIPPSCVEDAVATDASSSYGSETAQLAVAPPHIRSFQLGGYEVAVSAQHEADRAVLESLWQEKSIDLDLNEPFTRIREAIEEAHGVGK
ncbi:hypothetical protein C5Y96_04085 [Blastopirellula marina]|uniref:Uncharacterized protein n=1 Tax=Blastopirellula marina TaxID=124 RepID=A0A2S8G466_9BACT|nr:MULTISPECIES: hypothetical protein [Pirellulaceae]PQO39051.1 hypothetical protein C5Y96_04085 [Blastopirellula marina]RCS55359.1 hypothetical protein DTL36_04090 [Bremerella cremea]